MMGLSIGRGGGGAAFSPLQLPDLALWLDASQIYGLNDGDAVAQWNDLSGNGRNATQATTSKKPTWETGEANGHPVVRFDGVDDIMATPAFTTFPAKRGTLFVVSKSTTVAGYDVLLATADGSGVGWISYLSFSGPKYKWYDGADRFATNYDPGTWQLQSFRRTADTSLEFKRNGTLEDTLTIANNQPDSKVLSIGATVIDLSYFGGDIAAVLFYGRSLSTVETARVENWLNSRYALY